MEPKTILTATLLLGLVSGKQLFIPVHDDAETIFKYEMIGAAHFSDRKFVIKSMFDLHVRNDSESRLLRLHIENPSGKIGLDEWTEDVIRPLKQPFNISLDAEGAPESMQCDWELETNYTRARKDFIFQQFKDIHGEFVKYFGKRQEAFQGSRKMENMPFGTCTTRVNASLTAVYFNIEYEARRAECEGKVDPFFTFDMDADLFPQSEFLKSFAFTKDHLDFQLVRLDALIKLQSSPEIDAEIYTLITLKEILMDPEPEKTTTTLPSDS